MVTRNKFIIELNNNESCANTINLRKPSDSEKDMMAVASVVVFGPAESEEDGYTLIDQESAQEITRLVNEYNEEKLGV